MKKCHKSSKVSRIEDDDNMLHIRAVRPDVLAELLCNLAVALEKVLAGHALLARRSAGRYHILGAGKGLLDIVCIGNVRSVKCTVIHFFCHTLEPCSIRVIQAYMRS